MKHETIYRTVKVSERLPTQNDYTMILKINHLVFKWYYKRCGEHFRQWTFIKSVKLLIENYEHNKLWYEAQKEMYQSCTKRNADLEKQIHDMKFKQVATDDQIKWANKNFGTDFSQREEN